MSVLSKLSSSPGDSNANNVTIPGESTAMQPQNGNASYKRTESPTTRSEVSGVFSGEGVFVIDGFTFHLPH